MSTTSSTRHSRPGIRISAGALAAAAAMVVAPFAVSAASAAKPTVGHPMANCAHSQSWQRGTATTGTDGAAAGPAANPGGTTGGVQTEVPDPAYVVTSYGSTITGGYAPVGPVDTVGSTITGGFSAVARAATALTATATTTTTTTTTEPTVTTTATATTTEPTVTATKAQVLAHTGVDDNTILIGGVAAAVILAGAGFIVIARRRVKD